MYRADNSNIHKQPGRLFIGPYYISITEDYPASSGYRLPTAAMAFVREDEADDKFADFSCIISAGELPDIAICKCIASYSSGPSPYRIFRMGPDELLWIRYKGNDEVRLAYAISEGWSKWRLIADRTGTLGVDSFLELGYIFAYSVIKKDGLMLHGVVMEWAGMGIIVCAHSGVGKSTHTNIWESREQARIINGDKALCYKEKDAWYSCGAPWCGSSGKYINKRLAISAIVLLERSNKNRVERLSHLQGAIGLIGLTYAPGWDEELMNKALDLLDEIVEAVPVYRLYCRPDYEAVAVLKQELENLNGLVG